MDPTPMLHTPTRDDALNWLRLALVPGVSDASCRTLVDAFGTPEGALEASPASVSGVAGPAIAAALAKGAPEAWVERAMQWLDEPGHHLLSIRDPRYPQALLDIHDPPVVLYAQGRLELLNAPALAIVGSRNATPQGMRDAEAFATSLSNAGLAIVSGLALGIDAAAHRGGLAGRSSSIAVIGTGADRIYPARNAALARSLAVDGVIVSEFPLGTAPAAENFPRRNRIISGMSRGTLVVEAALASGSLITARCALDQNREVFAVPGSIHSPLAKGGHALIKDGAKLVECADDILLELRMEPAGLSPRGLATPQLRSDPLLDALGDAPASIDELSQRTLAAASHVAARIAELEIEGRVALVAGGRVQRLHGPDADAL
ncbi:DNA-processing protein DprA [Usitatibacter palustris]|nr:DNA-processing protein DprA [Usitatibacter palustris]